MKKLFFLFTHLLITLNTNMAKNIDLINAQTVARNFFYYSTNISIEDIILTYLEKTKDGDPIYFVFNIIQNNGFIIVSGEDAALPILGYSTTGQYNPNNLPQNFAKWLEGYKQQILYIKANNLQADSDIQNKWQSYKNNHFYNARTTAGVNPLLNTTWNQSPYYNDLCPGGSVTGCVATAMAQVMKYWNHPAQGTGFHSYNEDDYGTLSANFGNTNYDWSNMPNNVTSSNNAVATLMYHCGVSVNMNYSPESSGAYVIAVDAPDCSENTFKNYFGYKSSLQGLSRKDYSDPNWKSLLKAELDASRPILYDGFGSGGGHAFVCDGYDNNDFFHFNWGWGGYYDGFFEIDALNPTGTGTGGGTGGYNNDQQAIIGIEPATGSSTTYDMRLFSDIIVNPNPINYNSGFSVTVDLANFGTSSSNNFSGDYSAAIFNSDDQFIDYIETKTGYSLEFNKYYQLDFSTSSIPALTPGYYKIGIYYMPAGENQWHAFDNGSYQNFTSVQVQGNNTNPLKLYAEIITIPSIITQNEPFEVYFDITNEGSSTFTGEVSVDIHKSDGTWIRELSKKTVIPLDPNYHYTDGLTYSISDGINDEPGTYQLFVWDLPDGGNWENVGNGSFSNPITIQVAAPGIDPDFYENNNTANDAYNLQISFSGNDANINTLGSNIHITSDNDFYKIILNEGYDYQITARVHDSYNSGDGNTYTCDALFSYDMGYGSSETFDDIMPSNISINNGGTIIFQVAPYFAGEKGTYLLDINITRVLGTAINDFSRINDIKIFPDPTSKTISFEIINPDIELVNTIIQNYLGQTIKEFEYKNNSLQIMNFDVSELPNGVYYIQVQSNEKFLINKKFTILH